MGYTIYIYYDKFTDDEWTELRKRTEKMLADTDIPVANRDGDEGSEPEINDKFIVFNGVEEDAHESAVLCKDPATEHRKPREGDNYFNFCKTARKAYDPLVMEFFMNAYEILGPERCRVSNGDGYSTDPEDYDLDMLADDEKVSIIPHSDGVEFPNFPRVIENLTAYFGDRADVPKKRETRRIVKITSDGTPQGTEIILDDGSHLLRVNSLAWKVHAAEPSCHIAIDLEGLEVDLETKGDVKIICKGQTLLESKPE